MLGSNFPYVVLKTLKFQIINKMIFEGNPISYLLIPDEIE